MLLHSGSVARACWPAEEEKSGESCSSLALKLQETGTKPRWPPERENVESARCCAKHLHDPVRSQYGLRMITGHPESRITPKCPAYLYGIIRDFLNEMTKVTLTFVKCD